jgi:hypothetical protein
MRRWTDLFESMFWETLYAVRNAVAPMRRREPRVAVVFYDVTGPAVNTAQHDRSWN